MRILTYKSSLQVVILALLLASRCFGVNITETFRLDFDVLSPDLSTVICSTASADCSAFRPLLDVDTVPYPGSGPGNPPPVFQQYESYNTALEFSIYQTYDITNLSNDYAFRVSPTYEAAASGVFRLRSGTGPANLTWLSSQAGEVNGLSNSGLGLDFFFNSVRNEFGEGVRIPPVAVDFETPISISLSATFAPRAFFLTPRFNDFRVTYGYGYINVQPFEVNGVFDDNLTLEEVLPVPEPASAALLTAGLAILALRRISERRQSE